ncbi:MAG: hypothetical protein R2739_11205 [Chitinophagales bacterium]
MKNILMIILSFPTMFCLAQTGNVGIGTATPNASAILDVTSTNKGILAPRVSIGDVSVFGLSGDTKSAGMIVYNTNTGTTGGYGTGFYYWDGSKWQKIVNGSPIRAQNAINLNTTTPNASAQYPYVELGGALIRPTTISGLSSTNKLSFTGSGVDAFNVDGTTFSVDATNNRVGIGTATPSALLHINVPANSNNNPDGNGIYVYNAGNSGDNDDAIITARVNGSSAGDPFIALDIDGVQGWSMGVDNSDGDKLKFANAWSDPGTNTRMTIQPDGNVGIGTTTPSYKLSVNGTIESQDFTGAGGKNILIGDDAFLSDVDEAHTIALISNSTATLGKLRLGSNSSSYIYGNNGNLGLKTTTTTQDVNIGGRMYISDGVIQRGGSAITGTSDLGLYSRVSGNYIRIVTNGGEVNFYSDDNTGSSVNVSILSNGKLEARKGFSTERQIRFYKRSRNNGGGGVDNLGNYDFCYLAGVAFRNTDSNVDEDDDYQCNVYSLDINGNADYDEQESTDYTTNFGYSSRPYWRMYSECYADCSNSTCTAICINFDY